MRKIFGLVLIVFFNLNVNAQNGCSHNLSVDSFQIELQKVRSYDFDQAKKEAIKILLNQCLTSLQVKELIKELSFEEDKIEIAKKAFSKVSDPSNFTIIKTALDFEKSQNIIEELMK